MDGRDADEAGEGYASPACFMHELAPGMGEAVAVAPPEQRSAILRWRKGERERLIAERMQLPSPVRVEHAARIARHLDALLPDLAGRVVSLYWPMRGEPDLRAWLGAATERGATCALPLVVEKHAPMAFRSWKPGEPLERGFWNIPVPKGGTEVTPDIVLAPLVGFDGAHFRLGYGGGYFDRTLAALPKKPYVVGVGYVQQAIRTIHPLAHDIPMDAIVTEQSVVDGRAT